MGNLGTISAVVVAAALAGCAAKPAKKLGPIEVTTLAGNGKFDVDGTGGPNGTAVLTGPDGISVDSNGNIYVADFVGNRIRKIDALGNVTTVAGSGPAGYDEVGIVDGTGGPNGTAQFQGPGELALDASGNIYVVDYDSIRVIAPSGDVATLISECPFGAASKTGCVDAIFGPAGVAVDGIGNWFVSDADSSCIWKIDEAGTVTNFSGSRMNGFLDGPGSDAQFNGLGQITIDGAGNIYAADRLNNRIRKIDPTGNVTTVAGNGFGVGTNSGGYADGTGGANGTAEFYLPSGVAVDSQGAVYVADTGNQRIRIIDLSGNVTTLAGNGTLGSVDGSGGPSGTAEFKNPSAVTVDSLGNVFVADRTSNQIRKVDPMGNVTTVAGSDGNPDGVWSGGANGTAEFYQPDNVAVDRQGNVYVADSDNNRICKITPDGTVTTLAGNGVAGNADGSGGSEGTAEFDTPGGVAVGPDGIVYVDDSLNGLIRKIDRSGNVSLFAPSDGISEFEGTVGIAADSRNNVYVTAGYQVWKIAPSGTPAVLAGNGTRGFVDGTGGPNGTAEFGFLVSVAVDTNFNVYVADGDNNRIRKIFPDGNVVTLAGGGNPVASGNSCDPSWATQGIDGLGGVAVDEEGNVYFTSGCDNRVGMVDPAGHITMLAGNGSAGSTDGAGDPNDAAEFSSPAGIAVDSGGTLYVADFGNNRIRKITQ